MKNLFNSLLLVSFILFTLTACNKNGDLPVVKKTAASSVLATKADTVVTPVTPVQYATTSFAGDQITLVPYIHGTLADSSYISFVAQTKNSYCGTSKMGIITSLANDNYSIDLKDVVQPSPCAIGNGPIGQELSFTQNTTAPLSSGTFPLAVTFNGKTYTGSITATATAITFNWNYTAGVLISPKQISR